MTNLTTFSLAGFSLLALACQQSVAIPKAPEPKVAAVHSGRGAELFESHCAVCHGIDGKADGPASQFLFPPARSFDSGKFRLVSTVNGVPRDEDLIAMLRRGMPGSAMPSWDWLGDAELQALATHTRELAVLGMADRLVAESAAAGTPLSFAEARESAAERMTPGEVLPPTMKVVDANLGTSLFRNNCSPCHGMNGEGTRLPQMNEDGGLNWARNLTAGYLKGGATTEELAWRISAGMPGSAMPATKLDKLELSSLVAHVQSLIPDRTDTRLVQVAERLRVRRVATDLPRNPDDRAWEQSDEVNIVLAPLWWRDESVVYATLAAVHDGESIAIRVRWPDATGKTTVLSDATRADAVALQLSLEATPPLFGMGASDSPTTIWHWKSIGLEEVAGALELLEGDSDLSTETLSGEVHWDAPVYHSLDDSRTLSEDVEQMTARGVDSMRDTERRPSDVAIGPRWSDGEWSVVFSRGLVPANAGDIELTAGGSAQVACAIWNGAAGDRGPQKSISIWHEFALDD